jgi:hypothetical protein
MHLYESYLDLVLICWLDQDLNISSIITFPFDNRSINEIETINFNLI